MIRDQPEIVIYALIAVGCAALLASGIYHGRQHEAFLKSHGCQLLTKAPTGRQVYCGKSCVRPEEVFVYECADGWRTEVY